MISKTGEVSIRVSREETGVDIKNSLPDDFFRIETKDSSYIVIEKGEKSLILMPKSTLVYSDNNFNLESGYLYTKSRNGSDVNLAISNNTENSAYNISGKSFALYSDSGEISAITHKQALKLKPQASLGINYVLEPYNKTRISPSLTDPITLTDTEKTLLANVSMRLDVEIATELNKNIDRYSFKLLKNTANETSVFRLVHKKPGKNIFIIVPHGNERVGTDVLSNRLNMPIKSGSLTIVPIAVPSAYKGNKRIIENQDINRLFVYRKKDKTDVEKLATAYMKMLKDYKIDVLITLHEGNGFQEFFEDAIIYDDKRLASTASKVVANINKRVEPYKFKFRSMHHPMPTTMTYYAAGKKMDAYGIEITAKMSHDRKFAIMDAILTELFDIYGL